MFSQVSMPSTSSVLSAYTTFAASAMVVKTMLHEVKTMAKQLIPQQLQDKILSGIERLIGHPSSQMMTLVIDEYNGYAMNQIFEASEVYLQTKITSPSLSRLRVFRAPRENNTLVTIGKGEKVVDEFQGIQLKWEMVSSTDHQKQSSPMGGGDKGERRSIELSFLKKHTEKVMESYLSYVVEKAETIKEEKKVVKLYSLGNPVAGGGAWGSINLDHPSTFETLAMDFEVKEELIKDLERFVRRREFYKRVGKAWKRGYLLYGPPGTGKTSLIAAMANYLKFDVYDLEVTSLQRNSQLRKILVSTKKRSILVIEDIDCTADLQDRQVGAAGRINNPNTQLTLSGLLNFIDGLWSSCGDERIIVFTTNHKERLDPALLRPGRMDMHIHMSYCTPYGFKTLASNYLGLTNHTLFSRIERLITEVEVTPAQIAEELMRTAATQQPDLALQALLDFLNNINVNAAHTGAGKHQLPLQEPHVQTKRQKIWGEGIEGFDYMPPVSAHSFL